MSFDNDTSSKPEFCTVRNKFIPLISLFFFSCFLASSANASRGPWITLDAKNGRVIEQKDALRPWYPASITKLMTAFVTFKAIKAGKITLQSPVIISARAQAEPASKMGFRVGTKLSIETALKLIMVKSANDIAVAIAENVSGSHDTFVADMNRLSRELGMRDTTWTNPNGLPDKKQVSTARDLSLMAYELWRQFPQYRSFYDIRAIKHGKRTMKNYNSLLHHMAGANGMKTGYICDSAYNVASSATKNGKTRIAVVLGASNGIERAIVAKHILTRSFVRNGGVHVKRFNKRPSVATPPPHRYCKTIKDKLDALGLMQAYGGSSKKAKELIQWMAYNKSLWEQRRKAKKRKRPTKAERRDIALRWAKMQNFLLGPQLAAARPHIIRLGAPTGQRPFHVDDVPRTTEVILPKPKPEKYRQSKTGASISNSGQSKS